MARSLAVRQADASPRRLRDAMGEAPTPGHLRSRPNPAPYGGGAAANLGAFLGFPEGARRDLIGQDLAKLKRRKVQCGAL